MHVNWWNFAGDIFVSQVDKIGTSLLGAERFNNFLNNNKVILYFVIFFRSKLLLLHFALSHTCPFSFRYLERHVDIQTEHYTSLDLQTTYPVNFMKCIQ